MNQHRRFAQIVLLLIFVAVPGGLTYRAVRLAQADRALIAAVKANDPAAARAALRNGADPNCRAEASPPAGWRGWLSRLWRGRNSNRGDTALSIAIGLHAAYEDFHPPVVVGYTDNRMIELLETNGANPNIPTLDGSTPLLQAVEMANPETVNLLLGHKAAVNVRDRDGNSPLMIAVGHPTTRMARILLERGAEIEARDNTGVTPLMRAAEQGTPDMVRFLIHRHAIIDARDNSGMTALQHAVSTQNTEAARILRQAGAKQ